MPRDLTFSCTCGTVQGRARGLTQRNVRRLFCYCPDCRAFLNHVGAENCISDDGGADLVATLPGRITFTAGHDQIAALRLSKNGLLRWYATCCGMPLGNMPAKALPRFVSVPRAVFKDPDADSVLGTLKACVNTAQAPADCKPPKEFGFLGFIGFVGSFHMASVLGLAPKGTPYFDEQGTPIVTPYVLTKEERAAARA